MELKMYKNFLPFFIMLQAGFGKSLTDGAMTVGRQTQTRQIRYPGIVQGRQTFQQMSYRAIPQRRQPYQTVNERRAIFLPGPYSSYRQPRSSSSRSESSTGNIGLLLYLLFRDTTTACTVNWGSWTECNFQDVRHRNRECPDGLETEEGECSIECMSWGSWSTCSTPEHVDEKKSRTRQCVTGFQTEEEDCYPNAVGFTSDGWYRYSNGHEYKYLTAETNYGAQSSFCASHNSRLATVAVRNGELGGFQNTIGVPDFTMYFVGGTDAIVEDTWIFQDSIVMTTDDIKVWAENEPNDDAVPDVEDCLAWFKNLNKLGDTSCSNTLSAMCERPIA